MATSAYGISAGRNRALATYKSMSVETASPGELVLMLYNESLRAMREASAAIDRKDIESTSSSLLKAQDIVTELQTSLNPSVGGDLAKSLDSMYEYVGNLLVESNVRKSQEPLQGAMRVMGELRDGWQEALGRHG